MDALADGVERKAPFHPVNFVATPQEGNFLTVCFRRTIIEGNFLKVIYFCTAYIFYLTAVIVFWLLFQKVTSCAGVVKGDTTESVPLAALFCYLFWGVPKK